MRVMAAKVTAVFDYRRLAKTVSEKYCYNSHSSRLTNISYNERSQITLLRLLAI
jgi:hypothetical protein